MVMIGPPQFEMPAGDAFSSARSLITVEVERSGKMKVSLPDGVTDQA